MAFLREHLITVSFLPTPLAEAVLALPVPDGLELRVLGTGGDRLHVAPEPRHPFALVNAYGPTEATVMATATVVPVGYQGTPPIGRPVNDARIEILDADLAPVADGTVGELHIGGDALARGYLHRPDLTADGFRPHPRPEKPGMRLYRTGDLAYRRDDGTIEFVGRRDDQVKIHGHRIELGEIEVRLTQHGAVSAAAAKVARSTADEPYLVAYVVPGPGAAPTAAELRDYLAGVLPTAMVPRSWVFLTELPLSRSGKVDRAALPEPRLEEAADEPVGPVERFLASLWIQLLGRAPGRTDDFFEAGGHSLLATQLAARMRTGLELPTLPLNALFQAPTISALAELATAVEAEPGRTVELAGLHLMIDSMSHQELADLLAEEPDQPRVD